MSKNNQRKERLLFNFQFFIGIFVLVGAVILLWLRMFTKQPIVPIIPIIQASSQNLMNLNKEIEIAHESETVFRLLLQDNSTYPTRIELIHVLDAILKQNKESINFLLEYLEIDVRKLNKDVKKAMFDLNSHFEKDCLPFTTRAEQSSDQNPYQTKKILTNDTKECITFAFSYAKMLGDDSVMLDHLFYSIVSCDEYLVMTESLQSLKHLFLNGKLQNFHLEQAIFELRKIQKTKNLQN